MKTMLTLAADAVKFQQIISYQMRSAWTGDFHEPQAPVNKIGLLAENDAVLDGNSGRRKRLGPGSLAAIECTDACKAVCLITASAQ
jgi:hypothetical protein